jgi:hypothetical protein
LIYVTGCRTIRQRELRKYITPKHKKVAKKNHHRKQRRKAKEDKEYIPKYNRYDGWAV